MIRADTHTNRLKNCKQSGNVLRVCPASKKKSNTICAMKVFYEWVFAGNKKVEGESNLCPKDFFGIQEVLLLRC